MSALTRVCPKCGDVWAAECDFCCSCGAPLISRSAIARMRRETQPRVVTKGRRRQHCVYCGGVSYALACQSHKDLLTLDPGFRR